jgi:hypothetical protein
MRSDNSIHLTTAAKRRHELTRAKAIAAQDEVDRAGDPITLESVADHAGVSRSWLYTQTDLKDEIRRLRWTLRSSSGRCAHLRRLAEGHPQTSDSANCQAATGSGAGYGCPKALIGSKVWWVCRQW